MNFKISDVLLGLVFIGLIIGTGSMQSHLKEGPQIFILLFGLIALASLLVKPSFFTSIPFYILLGIMIFINALLLTNFFVNLANPHAGWFTDNHGVKHRAMHMNWVWGVISGIISSILALFFYHKLIKRNRNLEISLITIFIVVTAIIYVKNEIL